MTKEQAFKNLSLPSDADMEAIRMRFAARYTLSDAQYDRTLTEGMKAVHEQHLRKLEQAYKVATGNPVIDDMGALLSLGKGYIEEDSESIKSDDHITSDEALAFFALYPHDSPLLAEQRYTQYVLELEEAMKQVGLEASKEPYRLEIARAEQHLNFVANYLLANQMLTSQQEEVPELTDIIYENQTEEQVDKDVPSADSGKASNLPRYATLIAGALVLLVIGIWIGRGKDTKEDDGNSFTTTVETQPSSNRPHNTPQAALPENPTSVPPESKRLTTESTIPSQSPQQIIESIIRQYTDLENVNAGKSNIQLEGKDKYVLPYNNIRDINARGEFVGTNLIVNGTSKQLSDGLHLSGISVTDRKILLQAIEELQTTTEKSVSLRQETDKRQVSAQRDTTDKEKQLPSKDNLKPANDETKDGEKQPDKMDKKTVPVTKKHPDSLQNPKIQP